MAHPNTGEPVALSGTATTSPVRVMITDNSGRETHMRRITFHNEDLVNKLLVNFGGSAFLSVLPAGEYEVLGEYCWFIVKSSAGNVPWSANVAAA